MLKKLVLLLLLANLGFFAWTQGWLDGVVGVRAIGDREPERLARQVRPELVQILPPGAAGSGGNGVACVEAGPFDAAQLPAATEALRTVVPAERWSEVSADRAGAWVVYMGPFLDRAGLDKKSEELRRLKLAPTELRGPPELEPGLVLGQPTDRDAAEAALAAYAASGVRSARVVQTVAPASRTLLRVDRADAGLAARLQALRNDAFGAGFRPCARPPAN